MKKLLFTLLVLMSVVSISSCSSNDTEKKLDGTWTANLADRGLLVEYKFDAADKEFEADFKVAPTGVELVEIEMKGKFSATPDELTLRIDPEQIDVELSDALIQATGLPESELEATKQAMLEEIVPDVSKPVVNQIKSINANELVLVKNGTTIALSKK